MRTVITYMYRLGPSWWRVHLECSHKISVSNEEMERHQLFIGKLIKCGECAQNEGMWG